MTRRLHTDKQFEKAFRAHASVYVKERTHQGNEFVGGLDGFNPLYVTVSGRKLLRDDFFFTVVD